MSCEKLETPKQLRAPAECSLRLNVQPFAPRLCELCMAIAPGGNCVCFYLSLYQYRLSAIVWELVGGNSSGIALDSVLFDPKRYWRECRF